MLTTCVFQPAWRELPPEQRYANMARQGVSLPTVEGLMVADPETMQPVPRDGQTVCEIMMRGNTVMKGNAHARKAGLVDSIVSFDLSQAKVVVSDVNGDGSKDANDLSVGDRVVVKAKLPRKEPGDPPYATTQTWVIGAVWGVALAVVGFVFFWHAEERYGRE